MSERARRVSSGDSAQQSSQDLYRAANGRPRGVGLYAIATRRWHERAQCAMMAVMLSTPEAPVASASEVWAGLGAAATVITLATALINRRSALVTWRSATLAAGAAELAMPGPKLQLPSRTHLVDREQAMEHAAELIRNGEAVISIEGEMGVGKSAVAKELAHRLNSPGGRPAPDLRRHTFFWVDGANGCPHLSDICASLSLLTGDQSLSTVAARHKLDALRAHLAANKTVLVLDNLRLGDDPESEPLRELLRTVPTGTLVIATANRRREFGAAPVTLDDLRPAYVRELIDYEVRRLGLGDGVVFDEAVAHRLQDAVGGNPGRIEWFLRTLRGSAQSVEERLAALERGEDLEAVFAPVWQELTANAKTVLSACAYLRGEGMLEQIAIASGFEEPGVAALLEELIELGLVTPIRVSGRPNLFKCPHGVQQLVRFDTAQTLVDEFTTRLTDHYIDYFSANWEDASAAIPHVGALEPILEELFSREDDAKLQALAVASEDILFSLGLFDARIACGTLSFESATRANNHCAASLASEVLSSTHVIRGEFDDARAALALGALAAERSGARGELARQMRCRGFVHYRSREPEEALRAIDGADELARAGGELHSLVNILNLRSYAKWYLRAMDESAAAADASLAVCEEIGWERAKAFPIRQLAEVATHRREFARARELLARARRIAAAHEDKRHLARLHLAEARLGLNSGDLDTAAEAALRGEREAAALSLPPEAREARALRRAAGRARAFPPLRLYYRWRRPIRLTDAPVF